MDAVYYYDGGSVFALASENKLIRVNGESLTETVLTDLGNKYKNAPELTENNIKVASQDGKTFYVCRLNDSSWIWNRMKSYSWINRISKYSYSVYVITVSGEGESSKVDVSNTVFPASSGLYTAVKGDLGKIYFIIDSEKEKTGILYSTDGETFSEICRGDIKLMKAGDVICFALFGEDDVTIYSLSEVNNK